jgi:hypothetical protein
MAKHPKLTDMQIQVIVTNELSNANVTASSPTFLRDPLAYYLGLPNGAEVVGRSQITSTDVADAIEWIIPQVMKSFTQNNEIVIFDPVNEQDTKQAELESEYVYDILMKKNNGFILIHQFVKDALMQRNGVLKVYYEDNEDITYEEYTGLNEVQLQMLLADKEVELMKMTQNEFIDNNGQLQTEYDVKISITKKSGKICIDPVPPEQFRVSSQHNSIDLSNARFSAHIVTKSVSDLREEGFDEKIIEKLPATDLIRSAYRFYMQNEPTLIPVTFPDDVSSKLVEIGECFLRCDRNGDGFAELLKVTTAGVQPVTDILEIMEVEDNPWISTTAILMSHKYQGISIYDRLKQVQDNKTALIRNIMDNIYLQNNQIMKVVEGQVNIDDLLTSRPGAKYRMKRLDALEVLVTPPVGQAGFEMMTYLDRVRAGRVGVSPEGNASPEHIGDRVGSEGVDRMMNAQEELVGLIIRVICETGIKPLMCKIRDLAMKHFDVAEDFNFRGEWVKVNPSSWIPRVKSSVRVGTGSGDTRAKQAALQNIMAMQEKIMGMPGQALCNPSKIYATLDDACKFAGLNGASKYFVNPDSPEGQQATQQAGQKSQEEQQKQEQMSIEQMRQQAELAKSATTTAEAEQKNVTLKAMVDFAKHNHALEKLKLDTEIAHLKHQLESAKWLTTGVSARKDKQDQLDFDYDKLHTDSALKLVELEAKANQDEKENFLAAQQTVELEEESEGGANE